MGILLLTILVKLTMRDLKYIDKYFNNTLSNLSPVAGTFTCNIGHHIKSLKLICNIHLVTMPNSYNTKLSDGSASILSYAELCQRQILYGS